MSDFSTPSHHLLPVFNCLPGAYLLLSPDLIIEAASDAYLEATLSKRERLVGCYVFEAMPDNPQTPEAYAVQNLRESLNQVIASGQPHQMTQQRYDVPDPEKPDRFVERHWLPHNIPVLDEQGQLQHIIHSVLNITPTVLAKAQVQESETRFQTMAEAAGILIAQTDEVGNAIYFNQEWLTLTGRTREDLINYGWADLFHEEDRAGFVEAYRTAFAQRQVLKREFRLRGQTGEYRWQLAVVSPRFDTNGTFTGYISSCVDITELKQVATALSQSEDQFRAFADNIQNLAWMAHPDGWIYWYNQQWYHYTGTTLAEMQGWGWDKVHHPDHRERVLAFITEAWVKGDTWELTFPLKGANDVYRWFLTRGSAIKDAAGQVVRWIGTNTDITEQIKAEETLQKRNVELQRINNDLDNFIYTASHDLKAPILNIEGLMAALQDQLSPASLQAEDVQHTLDLILDSVQRFKRTIGHLTEVTKLQKENNAEATPVDMAAIIAEIQLDLALDIRAAQAEVEVKVISCPTFYFSEKNLRSIIYNLLSNALKYRAPTRKAVVQIHCSQTKDYYVLSVQDNGLGMDLSGNAKLFTMFKRLHNHVEGSGIGLYMVKKILDNAGGKIEVESTVDQGSTFRVYFQRTKFTNNSVAVT